MQSRRIFGPLFAVSSRSCYQHPFGPSRSTPPPPWAVEKLLNEGYKKEEILNNWQALVEKKGSNLGGVEKMFAVLRKSYDISPSGIKEMIKKRRDREYREDQIYRPELAQGVGPEVAAAKFLLQRSAAVKFSNMKNWLVDFEGAEKLPGTANPAFKVEAVDLRSFQIHHRGLENFARCSQLASLKMVNQKFIDDFCLDAISGMFNLSLRYLDVSGCQLITERGLSILHRCRNLRLLNVYNLPRVQHPELLALLLEEALPHCEIRGINYLEAPQK